MSFHEARRTRHFRFLRNMIPYVVVGILFFVCYLISMFEIFNLNFKYIFYFYKVFLFFFFKSKAGSCCSNKWAALALECFLRALDPDWAPALMIGPYGTEASSSALDPGQLQQEIKRSLPPPSGGHPNHGYSK